MIKRLLDRLNPQDAVDILAIHHVIAWTLNVGCLLALLLGLFSFHTIILICAINWGFCWLLLASLFGCPLKRGEDLYRKKAGLGKTEAGLVYVRNLIIRLIQRIRNRQS